MKCTKRDSNVQLTAASSTTTCTEDTNSERALDRELLRWDVHEESQHHRVGVSGGMKLGVRRQGRTRSDAIN